jgi:hypothetical protein
VIAGTSSRSLDSAEAASLFWSSAIPRVARRSLVWSNHHALNHSQRPTESGTDASARSVVFTPSFSFAGKREGVQNCVSSVLHSPR